jgi:TonB-linked SusC/RagA family outer membrane protein
MNFYDLTRHRFKTYRAGQLIRIMRLTIIIITALFIQVSAKSVAQKVTISAKNAPLLQLINELRLQTGYDFLYSDEMLKMAKPVTINAKQQQLETVLKQIFNSQRLVYVLKNKAVIVAMKEESLLDIVNSYFARIDVRGKVSDEKGKSLPGATVKVKNSDRIVITDANGSFVFTGIDEKAVLVISYLGYKTKEVPVKGIMSINLESADSDLEEVGVISTGYQKIKKDQLTGAASTIGEKDYNQRTAVTGNFLENLEGKVPGLVYNSASGEISIRGVSTFDAVKRPLIVVDGFPTEIDLSSINPNDVVSVSVLRDAAAASIYGVQASNGVIVVETRRGKSGKPVFNFRSTIGFSAKPDFGYLKYAGTPEYIQLNRDIVNTENDARFYYNEYNAIDPVRLVLFDQQDQLITEQQANEKIASVGSYNNLADYSRLFFQTRQAKQINFDVSGGNEKSTYLLGLNYVGERENEVRSKSSRVILNVANTYQFSKVFSFDFKGTYTHNKVESGKTAPYTDLLPYDRLVDDNGTALPATFGELKEGFYAINTDYNNRAKALGLYDQQYYPYAELYANTNKNSLNSFRAQGRLNTKITSWLSLDLGGAYENEQGLNDLLSTDDAYNVRYIVNSKAKKDPVKGTPLFTDLPQGDFLTKQTLRNVAYTLRGQFNVNYYSKDRKHNVSGIFGIEQRKTQSDSYKSTFFGYDGQSLINKPVNLQVLNSTVTPAFSEVGDYGSRFNSANYFSEAYNDRRFRSYYAQGTYVYDRRYVATGSLRIDQSNLFGVDPKYKNKPLWSAGVSWVLAEEEFMKPLTWVNALQVRAATGFNGNVPSSFNGPFLLLNSRLNTMLNSSLTYYDVLSPENQSIRWETTNNYNLGLDYGVLDNRISGTVDFYYKKTKDVFGIMSADPTLGFNQYSANTASIENKGLELMVNSLNINTTDFKWRTSVTASFNKNKVLAVQPKDKRSSYDIVTGTDLQKGYPMNAVFSYKYAGLNELGQPGVYDRNGNIKVMNDNSDFGGVIVDVDLDDLEYSGTTTPKYVMGLNNQISVGAFDFSVLLMYYGGHVMRVQQANPTDMFGGYPLQGAADYWKEKGDELKTKLPGLPVYGSPGDFGYAARYGFTYGNTYVRKADYIRLRDIIITYNLKNDVLKKAGVSNTQIRFQVQNPFKYTFSGNDVDPEAINKRTGIRTLPQQPFYSFTLSTNF